MHNNNNRRNNNNNRRFKGNNNNRRRFGGGGGGNSGGFDDESNININQRKNFANKRDQYLVKAKECLASGDRVDAENYYQHAEHCFRMMNSGLTNGARFDPVRMSIQNANYNEHAENGQGENHVPQHEQSQHHSQQQNGAPPQSDIAALPFMQPVDVDSNPNIIE